MDQFLGKESFPGPCATVAAFGESFVGRADFNGCIAFCNWRKDEVAAVLPAELELAQNTSSAPELHPVAFIFGEQTAGATIFAGVTFPMDLSYHEFAIVIPFVKHRRGRYLHAFVPRMYSSSLPATWAGNAHYGLAKQMARMRWQGNLFVMASPDETLLFHAAVEPSGEWAPASRAELANFTAARAVFALPVVGRRADGTYVTSFFGWDFDAARVRPGRAWLSIDAALVEGLAPRSCSTLASGTFEVRDMIWKLSWPERCSF